jgi:heme oxygenase
MAHREPSHGRGQELRNALRAATLGAHERLHRDPGLSAITAGQISRPDYCDLLARMLGFYVPLELALGLGPERSVWLRADLNSLDASYSGSPVPLCPYVPRAESRARRLGARYVIEGAAIGGQQLARRLDALLGRDEVAGRRFFIGRGTASGPAWRAFLEELATFEADTGARDSLIEAACETFGAFEHWLAGWSRQPAA